MEEEDTAAYVQFVTEEQYELLYLKLKEKLTEIEFFDSCDLQENEIKTYSICEMLSDIYQDMKDFVFLYDKNTAQVQGGALLMNKKYFVGAWGRHITVLLPYLHQLAYPFMEEETD
jgi:hypothetical protein